jgi:hypothetical protein
VSEGTVLPSAFGAKQLTTMLEPYGMLKRASRHFFSDGERDHTHLRAFLRFRHRSCPHPPMTKKHHDAHLAYARSKACLFHSAPGVTRDVADRMRGEQVMVCGASTTRTLARRKRVTRDGNVLGADRVGDFGGEQGGGRSQETVPRQKRRQQRASPRRLLRACILVKTI